MKRFFIDNPDESVYLDGSEHNHLANVLRLKAGEEVVLCCGDAWDYVYRIEQITKKNTLLVRVDKVPNHSLPKVRMTVFSALTKGDKPELIAQKLTELGVSEIALMTTRYTVTQHSDRRKERVEHVCMEAAKQCGRSDYPTIELTDFAAMCKRLADFDLIVFPYEKATTPSLQDFLCAREISSVRSVAVIVGSEGGFSDEEATALTDVGAVPVSLGKRILRAETANIAVTAIVMNALGEYR